jgi:geranylgeranyl diphosphate synthase type II
VEILERAGEKLGLAFQIQDDILDVTGSDEVIGKPVHSDEKNHKVTYVTVYGLSGAADAVEELSGQAVSLLESLDVKNDFLISLVRALVNREK